MKTVKILTLSALFSIFAIACSSDDNGNGTGDEANLESRLYASNNSDGNVTRYDVNDDSSFDSNTLLTLSLNSEGIYYDATTDQVTQASRSLLQLNTYADASITENGATITVSASSSADLISPRDIAVSSNIYVVADNSDADGNPVTADGRLFVYTKTGNNFNLRNIVTVNFKVWGIEFVGNDLFAVVDTTSDIAVFTNFASSNTTNATVEASKRITVEGITRTHGIAFDGGTMVLTDIGDADSDTDGGFHVITNFQSKFDAVANGGTLAVADQTRVSGALTLLGNPVAAEYDAENQIVYIAERANGGGRVVSYTNFEAGGNIGPMMNATLSGASSLYLAKE
ncbi:hypothetical protein ACFQO1_06420 [Jejudonia soesokkakensis]|uniref:Uncharacterized protein n=1 Tax=Jejudonia soesokkakensis TaxID=1323432 RepID=A0ABW2MR14_9FLAO